MAPASALLCVDDLSFGVPVYPGDTLTGNSVVPGKKLSSSKPDLGIVTWTTEGFNQRGERVIDFVRTNLIVKKLPRSMSAE